MLWIGIIALVAAASWFFGLGPGKIMRIPSLTGVLQAQAVQQLDEQGIPFRLTSTHDDNVAIGRVVATTPGPDASIMRFQGVSLQVSEGPELVQVPDLAGQAASQGVKQLEKLGLEKVKQHEQYSSTVPKGKIISQRPEAGDRVPRATGATLQVSKGPAPVKVPKLEGKQTPATG